MILLVHIFILKLKSLLSFLLLRKVIILLKSKVKMILSVVRKVLFLLKLKSLWSFLLLRKVIYFYSKAKITKILSIFKKGHIFVSKLKSLRSFLLIKNRIFLTSWLSLSAEQLGKKEKKKTDMLLLSSFANVLLMEAGTRYSPNWCSMTHENTSPSIKSE